MTIWGKKILFCWNLLFIHAVVIYNRYLYLSCLIYTRMVWLKNIANFVYFLLFPLPNVYTTSKILSICVKWERNRTDKIILNFFTLIINIQINYIFKKWSIKCFTLLINTEITSVLWNFIKLSTMTSPCIFEISYINTKTQGQLEYFISFYHHVLWSATV